MNTRLIHALLIAFAILCVTPTMAQTTITPKLEKKFEKTYEKAIKKGKDTYGAYHSKSVKEEGEFINYLKGKGLFIIKASYEVDFTEGNSIEDYVCRKHTSHSYDEFKKDCHFYFFSEWSMEPECWGSSYLRVRGELKGYKISWLGDVVNGNIEGKGIGVFRNHNKFYIITDCEFHHGFPITKGIITEIKYGPDKYYSISENVYRLKVGGISGISDIQGRGLCSSDALTRKASTAFYRDYCAALPEKERTEFDETEFGRIKGINDVEVYMGAFPNGRHIQEVTQWMTNGTEGFRVFQKKTIDNAINLTQTFIKEKLNGGSDLLDINKMIPINEDLSNLKNENERLLKRASLFYVDINKNLTNDKDAQEKAQLFIDYMNILNGFYAIHYSLDLDKCVENDWWGQIIDPNPRKTFILSSYGRDVKTAFEIAAKTINKRIEEKHIEESDLLYGAYDYIYNYYISFINAVNGKLEMKNTGHAREKLNSNSLKEYKFDNGELVITLQNNDQYRFRKSEGKWKYSSGNTVLLMPTSVTCNSVEEAIKEAEKMNRDFWNRGK